MNEAELLERDNKIVGLELDAIADQRVIAALEAQQRTDAELLKRFNRAFSRWACGSEFHNDPERIAARMSEMMDGKMELIKQQRTDREMIAELRAELAKEEPIYCPKCGSCGIVGCCKELRCQYVDDHHKAISENNEALFATVTTLEARLEEVRKLLSAVLTSFFESADAYAWTDVFQNRILMEIESALASLPATPKWLECVHTVVSLWPWAASHTSCINCLEGRHCAIKEALDRLTEAMKGTK